MGARVIFESDALVSRSEDVVAVQFGFVVWRKSFLGNIWHFVKLRDQGGDPEKIA